MNKKTRRKYNREFKQEAVKPVTEQGYKVSEAARNLGIRANMLTRWKHEFEAQRSVFNGSVPMYSFRPSFNFYLRVF